MLRRNLTQQQQQQMSRAVASCFIFTTTGCKYCEKAKRILSAPEHNLQYVALDVDFHRRRYQAAAEATKSSTVPLVFFGAHFVGGASEVEELAKQNKLVETYNQHVKSSGSTENNNSNNDDETEPLPFYLQELTEAEKKGEEQGQAIRDAEADIFSSSVRDYTISVVIQQQPTIAFNFTYSEIQRALRCEGNEAALALADSGWLLWKRKKIVKGSDLIKGVHTFLQNKAKSQQQAQAQAQEEIGQSSSSAATTASPTAAIVGANLNEAAPQVAAVLVNKLQMLYNSDESALTVATRNSNSSASAALTSSFSINPEALYRFQVDNDVDLGGKTIINGYRHLSSLVPANSSHGFPSADVIGRALWRAQDAMLNRFRDPADGLVDFAAIRAASAAVEKAKADEISGKQRGAAKAGCTVVVAGNDPLQAVRDLSLLLQGVDLSAMTDKEKIAFLINVYNTAVYVGFAVREVPWSNLQKLSFFGNVGFLIGGGGSSSSTTASSCFSTLSHNFFGLNDIENGLLRGNRKGVTDFFSNPISSSDPRLSLAVKNVDYRIHFALNCGAKSCPPVKVFTAENLDSELDAAAKSFLQSTTSWSGASKTLTVSQILKWYKEDFALPTTQEVVLKYLDSDLKEKIVKECGGDTSQINLAYAEYDWGFAAKK